MQKHTKSWVDKLIMPEPKKVSSILVTETVGAKKAYKHVETRYADGTKKVNKLSIRE